MEVLLNDTADGTSTTVPSAEADLKTFTTRENSFPLIRVEADVSISMVAASTAQAVTFRLRLGGLVKTYVFVSTTGAISNEYIHLTFQGRHNDKSAIRLTVQGAAADANTATLCKGFYVYGMQHSTLAG